MRRIGVLSILAESDLDWRASIKVFEHRLQELGWTAGRNVQINYRGAAGNVERLSTFAKELASMAPYFLLATNTPALAALQRMTDSVPIVFVQVTDPIGDGFVASFARPGGRITGLTNFEPTMGGKWLEISLGDCPRSCSSWDSCSIPRRLLVVGHFIRARSKPRQRRLRCSPSQCPCAMRPKLSLPLLNSPEIRIAVSLLCRTPS